MERQSCRGVWLPFCHIYDRKENCVRKYDFISALAKETAAEVVKNREECFPS